jgi:hypothetical protein
VTSPSTEGAASGDPMAVPEPTLDAEDAPLPEGEVVGLPLASGLPVTLRFPSPFEPWLTLGGKRVVVDEKGEAGAAPRELLLWSSRRLAALWRALEDRVALRAVYVEQQEQIVVTDLVSLEENVFFDHGLLRERLEAANVQLARFSLLGALATRAELERRVRATWAPGTIVEVRVEDGRQVVSRRRLRVGR